MANVPHLLLHLLFLHLAWSRSATSEKYQNNEILHDFSPFIRVHKDGRIERLMGIDFEPPSTDLLLEVSSKDVKVVPELNVSARIYLPKLTGEGPKKLPILVYFHGGGFVVGSAFSLASHNYLKSLVAKAEVVAVSVDYRLAPEHPVPAAHDDSWAALRWVASHVRGGGPEPWLSGHGDFDRVFVAGDSAGANIVNNMLMRAGPIGLGHGVKIDGAILIHPYFWGPKDHSPFIDVAGLWRFSCPSTSGTDDPLINPMAAGAPSLKGLGCARMVIHAAQKDFLGSQGQRYFEAVMSSGWKGKVEFFETKGKGHCFHLKDPTVYQAMTMMKQVASFIKQIRTCNA